MDPTALRVIEEAVKRGLDGAVPAWAAGVVVSGLVAAVVALWAWGYRLSGEFAAKIESLTAAHQTREDEREKRCEDRRTADIAGVVARKDAAEERLRDQLERREAARDDARNAHDTYRSETEAFLRNQVQATTRALQEATDVLELVIPALERATKGDSR